MLAVPRCGCAVCDARAAAPVRATVEAPRPLVVLRPVVAGPGVAPGVVVVLVGPPAAGKTTLRRELLAAGLDPAAVLSLDDLRRRFRAAAVATGLPAREAQAYSLPAVRRAARRGDALAAFGTGYLADATHLRRAERREHVGRAADAGLAAEAVLLPDLPLAELLRRNASRPDDERVPEDVLARFAHRRSLLDPDLLREEGFAVVHAPAASG
ncbi:AAA family ATPase [Kineococcus rubinsiae]|uniref:AAA family ATPase n=1 Tax=Kineococcus rubinsiae TaxID=2609562 RepID=UPI00142FFB1A|nr:AAA family ATPase [Kineococcus rubinsiae]NIZ91858.1 ATP-binding protein [Kineococcus rubinsiae]